MSNAFDTGHERGGLKNEVSGRFRLKVVAVDCGARASCGLGAGDPGTEAFRGHAFARREGLEDEDAVVGMAGKPSG